MRARDLAYANPDHAWTKRKRARHRAGTRALDGSNRQAYGQIG